MVFAEEGVTDPSFFIELSLSFTSATLLNISIKTPYNLKGKIKAKHSRQAQSL